MRNVRSTNGQIHLLVVRPGVSEAGPRSLSGSAPAPPAAVGPAAKLALGVRGNRSMLLVPRREHCVWRPTPVRGHACSGSRRMHSSKAVGGTRRRPGWRGRRIGKRETGLSTPAPAPESAGNPEARVHARVSCVGPGARVAECHPVIGGRCRTLQWGRCGLHRHPTVSSLCT